MFQNRRTGVVVPAYNEERLIGSTIKSIPPYIDRVYVVNDGSRDGTCRIVSEICQQDDRLVLINHPTNRGVGAAMPLVAGDNQNPRSAQFPERKAPASSQGCEGRGRVERGDGNV